MSVGSGLLVVHGAGASEPDPAPTTNTLPPGISTCGPVSAAGVLTGEGTTFPANDQLRLTGLNSSLVGVSQVSTVSRLPFGSSVQPSSSFGSFLPCPDRFSQFRPVSLNRAWLVLRTGLEVVQFWHAWDRMNVPLASTLLCASPMFAQPPGGATERHLLVTGL